MTKTIHPASVGDITPRWLTGALRSSGTIANDASVESISLRRIGEGVGIMGQLHVATPRYAGADADSPASVVVKMPSPFEENREQGVNLGMYEAEVRFYRELAGQTGAGMPAIHFAEIESGTADFCIVMEDLSHLELVDQATGMSAQQAAAAVRVLADVHAAWWGKVDTAELEWVPMSAGPRIEMVAEMMPQIVPLFVDRFAERLPDGGAEHAAWFGAHILDVYRGLAAASPTTLIHSDYRVENLLFGDPANDEVIVIDWQGMARGPGAYDLAYLLSGSMEIAARRDHERELVAVYGERLAGHGIDSDPDELWRQYRLANTVGGIATSVFTGATLDLANDRGFELIATMAERHFTAALDLEAATLV